MVIKSEQGVPLFFILANVVFYGTFYLSVYLGTWVIGILGAVLAAYYLTRIKHKLAYVIITVIMAFCFQNLVIGVWGRLGGETVGLSIMTQIPFVFLISAYLFLLIQGQLKVNQTYIMMFLLSLVILFSAFKSGSLNDVLVQIRNMITFFVAFELFTGCGQESTNLESFSRLFIVLGTVMLVAGVILLLGNFELYTQLGIANVYAAKGNVGEGLTDMPGRFSTDIFNVHMIRMGGLYYEPVTLSYFFSAQAIGAAILPWTKNQLWRVSMIATMGIALLLTGGKGGMLIAAAVLFATMIMRLLGSNKSSGKIWGTILITVSVFAVFSRFYSENYAGPAAAHFTTIQNTWQTILSNPLGHGIGRGGFNTIGDASFDTGAESGLMSIGYQMGIQGMVVLGLVFYSITRRLLDWASVKQLLNLPYFSVVGLLPLILFGTALFQLNTFTPQAIVPFAAIMAGGFGLKQVGTEYSDCELQGIIDER